MDISVNPSSQIYEMALPMTTELPSGIAVDRADVFWDISSVESDVSDTDHSSGVLCFQQVISNTLVLLITCWKLW